MWYTQGATLTARESIQQRDIKLPLFLNKNGGEIGNWLNCDSTLLLQDYSIDTIDKGKITKAQAKISSQVVDVITSGTSSE